jgi:hypothetical protein
MYERAELPVLQSQRMASPTYFSFGPSSRQSAEYTSSRIAAWTRAVILVFCCVVVQGDLIRPSPCRSAAEALK